jgi:hypothetical protein
MDYKELIHRLINELSFRVGIPDLKDKEQQTIISEILSEWGNLDEKKIIMEFLTEADPEKSAESDKKPEDEKYTNTGGSGYVKTTEYDKWKSNPDGFEGDTFTKEGPGVYKVADKNGGDTTTVTTGTAVGPKTDFAKKQAKLVKQVKAKENGEGTTNDVNKQKQVSKIDRNGFDKKDKKYLDNPDGPTRKQIIDDLNEGNLEVLSEFQDGVSVNREKGIAGAGGALASEGESKYCGAVDMDFDKWNSDNQEAISNKQNEFNRKKTADEKRTAIQLGLDSDSGEFNSYLAKREVWTQQQLEKVKSDKKSVFFIKGKKGFNGKDEPYEEWMRAAYDGAQTTKRAIEDTSIDTSKPRKTIQSTAEVDGAVQAHLEDSVENAKTPEDKKHFEEQLNNFNKFKSYHDTYVIGKDSEGRTTYMGISNKKDDQIRDPQNNSTPKKRFKQLEKKYGKEVAEGVTKSLEKNVQAVSDVKENTIKASSNITINDDYVAICDTTEMKSYLQKLRDNGKFRDYVKTKGMDPDEIGTKELLEEMNNHSKEIIEAGGSPSYEPYGKIAIKVGEFAINGKFRKENPKLNFNGESIKAAEAIKQNEKNVVKDSHTSVVKELVEADRPGGYSDSNPDADNGKHQQGYISGVLDACHIDSYIDMDSDDGMLLQMGINGVKPSMIRNCIAERSGFKGDSSTPEGKRELKDHLRKRCRITPGGDKITITDNGKQVELFEDTWRTAGTSQKVATKFGGSMRDCLQKKSVK